MYHCGHTCSNLHSHIRGIDTTQQLGEGFVRGHEKVRTKFYYHLSIPIMILLPLKICGAEVHKALHAVYTLAYGS